MLQFFASFLPLMAVIAATFLAASGAKGSGAYRMRRMDELGLGVENSPAQVAFFMFSFSAAIASTVPACSFTKLSGLLVLSLEILFLFSSLLLILLHRIKIYAPVSL